MKIVYFSNFLNHHQKLVADVLYNTTGVDYTFVETAQMYDWLKKGGYTDYSQEPYVLRAWENEDNRRKALDLAKNVDVAIFGGPEVLYLEILRARNTDKISFEVSERWLKKGWINLLSPRLLKSQWYYHTLFRHRNFYKLCSSAFGATDQYKMHSYIGRCYKWGYFTKVDDSYEVEAPNLGASTSEITPLMWCSRFLRWKHPELPVLLAYRLKEKGYRFHIDMFGSGEELDNTKALITKLCVEDWVTLRGNLPNEEILKEMRKHSIFLFTSDRNEGWGAVLNESMSNGCAVVGSSDIGSVPYLIKDGETGLIFKSASRHTGFTGRSLKIDEQALNSFTEKVEWLLDHPAERKRIAIYGYKIMRDIWSPTNAAQNLLTLIDCLKNGKDTSISDGPCSKAEIIKYTWM